MCACMCACVCASVPLFLCAYALKLHGNRIGAMYDGSPTPSPTPSPTSDLTYSTTVASSGNVCIGLHLHPAVALLVDNSQATLGRVVNLHAYWGLQLIKTQRAVTRTCAMHSVLARIRTGARPAPSSLCTHTLAHSLLQAVLDADGAGHKNHLESWWSHSPGASATAHHTW